MNGSISGINISLGVYPCALTKENGTGECSEMIYAKKFKRRSQDMQAFPRQLRS